MAFDWNDLRVFAAVLEHGSTARAARALGVEQTTCARRIAALETALGLELFVREASGYRPTPAALDLQPAVLAVAAEVGRFAHQVETAGRRRAQRLRVTGEDYLTRTRIVPALTRFAADYPDSQVEIDVTTAVRDLLAGEADLAVRAGPPPQDPALVRRKLRDDPWAMYCSETYAATRGAPKDVAEAVQHPIVCIEGALKQARAFGLGEAVRQVVESISAVEAVIRAGLCIGPLPTIVGDDAPGLLTCFDVPSGAGIWLVYPERLRHMPEIRALSDLIAEEFRRPAPR